MKFFFALVIFFACVSITDAQDLEIPSFDLPSVDQIPSVSPETIVNVLVSDIENAKTPIERAKATRKLNDYAQLSHSGETIKLLKSGLDHEHPDVRYESLLTLSLICNHRDRHCPVEVLKLAKDDYAKIKTNFHYILDFFSTYPPEALEYALDRYEKVDVETQKDLLVLLGKAGPKDQRVLNILKNAVTGNHAGKRVNGTAGYWHATQDFNVVLPLHFDRFEDARRIENLAEDNNGGFEGERAKTVINLAKEGISFLFYDNLGRQPDKFIDAIDRIASSDNAEMRRKLSDYLLECLSHPPSADAPASIEFSRCDFRQLRRVMKRSSDEEDPAVLDRLTKVQALLDEFIEIQNGMDSKKSFSDK